jgi:hypothetical protein
MHGGMDLWLHSFLTMTLDVGECTVSSTPGKRAPGTQCILRIGGWQNWSVYFWEDRYFLPLLGIEQHFLSHPENRLVAMVAVLVTSPWRLEYCRPCY